MKLKDTLKKKSWKKALILSLTALLAAGVLTGCGNSEAAGEKDAAESKGTIVVGGKTFTEGFLVSELYSLADFPDVRYETAKVYEFYMKGILGGTAFE